MWYILSHQDNPTILWPIEAQVPEGYVVEGETSNSNYLTDSVVYSGRHITGLAFRNRFTMHEKTVIELESADDPSQDLGTRMTAAAIRAYMKDAQTAAYIDLDREDTRAGVLQLEALGLLDYSGRALEILDAPITAIEKPTYPPKEW